MRLSLNRICDGPREALPGPLTAGLLSGASLLSGIAGGALVAIAALPGCGSPPAGDGSQSCVERRLGSMGTWLTLEVEAPTRSQALLASERAVEALESCERRLSTWGEGSELARLNATPVGETFALSIELAIELRAARRWWLETGGAFDPAVGGLVAAWDLRGAGRVPAEAEIARALAHGGFAALELEGQRATRLDGALWIEEGAFGKGAGLDAALRELRACGVHRAFLDLGGQVAVLGAGGRPHVWGIAHPSEREQVALGLLLEHGSLATSGNSERAIAVDGVRHGHILDPRTGRPAADFGSLSVLAPDALAADCLSTGLYVLGPEAALRFGREQSAIDVLVLEPQPDGRVRARATGQLGRALEVLDPRVDLERLGEEPANTSQAALSGPEAKLMPRLPTC